MLVVEHKPEVIAIADHVVDLGPHAGSAGGEVVFEGTVEACARPTPSPVDTLTTGHSSRRRSAQQSGSWRFAGRARTICKTWTLTSRSAYWWC